MNNNKFKYKAFEEEQLLLFPYDSKVDTEVPPPKQASLLYIESTDIHYPRSNIRICKDIDLNRVIPISALIFQKMVRKQYFL